MSTIKENLPIDGRVMTPLQFEEYIRGLTWLKPRTSIYLHHTWKPTVEDWRGASTIQAMRNTYMTYEWDDSSGDLHVGWDKGPHLFVAPDGIWLFYDIRKDGYHAGGNYNIGSIGVEMVGNYDYTLPSGAVWENTLAVLKVLFHYLNIPEYQIRFHRDVSTKTCPGTKVTKPWVIQALANTRLPSAVENGEASLPVETEWSAFKWADKYRMFDAPEHALQKYAAEKKYAVRSPEFWNDEDPNDDGAYLWVYSLVSKTFQLLRSEPPEWEVDVVLSFR